MCGRSSVIIETDDFDRDAMLSKQQWLFDGMTRDEVQTALSNPTGNIIKNAATLEAEKMARQHAGGVQAVGAAGSAAPLEFYTW